MTSLIYNTGTVSVTNGSAVVEGNLTGWAVALVTGGILSVAGMAVPILSVEDDTHLTLAYEWPGTNGSGKAYAISRDTSEAVRAAWTNDRLATIIQKLSLVGIHPDGSGTIAERDALDPLPATGYLWLYAEAGHDLAFYRKTDSGWEGPFEERGAQGLPGVGEGGYGLPVGGTIGQVPTKASATDGDVAWENPAASIVLYGASTSASLSDNSAAVNAAIADCASKFIYDLEVPEGVFQCNDDIVNLYGVRLNGPGALIAMPSGEKLNRHQSVKDDVYNYQHLWYFHNRLSGPTQRIVIHGDSTYAGGSWQSNSTKPENLIPVLTLDYGMPAVTVDNYAVGGTSAGDCNFSDKQTVPVSWLGEDVDAVVFGYGCNDSNDIVTFEANMRTNLETIRNQYGFDITIVLRSTLPMTDSYGCSPSAPLSQN